ncbi:hypothetical protein FUAX_32460 [Fulvitalea axinellae]|uniref:Alpha/beta hydrolase n=1 Tax=Fulvitalea axinellae TaxID=1182444 RepID=A0AAU9CF66_9BACT|nr:hypothetical protein FUAX_32460 [Fulvitalea axinellae]
MNNSKPRLIILSDLWGRERSGWLDFYAPVLDQKFRCEYFDCCELGDVRKDDYTQEALHRQFVDGGIERAAKKLSETVTEKVYVLAFSVGGAVAWRSVFLGLDCAGLFAVSSTRLRYEKELFPVKTSLYFGSEDPYCPDEDWAERTGTSLRVISGGGHALYMEEKFASKIAEEILEADLVGDLPKA